MSKTKFLTALALALALATTHVIAAPGLMNYSGRLVNSNGIPVATPTAAQFSFWDAATLGNHLGNGYIYQATIQPSADGLYSVEIGDPTGTGGTIPASIFDASEVWLNVNIGGEDLTPRARINSVGYAFQANTASLALQALGLHGTAFVTAQSTGTEIENGQALLLAYEQAKNLTPHGRPLAANNRATLLVPPGRFDLQAEALLLDTDFIDVIGLSTACANQYIHGTSNGLNTGVIMQTTGDVRLENLTVKCTWDEESPVFDETIPAAYFPDTDSQNTVIRNCEFTSDYQFIVEDMVPRLKGSFSMRTEVEYAGTYIDCVGEDHAFGSIASGTFINCVGGNRSFAGGGTASGVFMNCTGGDYSFGRGGTASGTFTRCKGGESAFGGGGGTASGTFTDCIAQDFSFGGSAGTASGTFINCTGQHSAFGGAGLASGTFTNCRGEDYAFAGGMYGTASGTFTNCIAGDFAFAGQGSATGGIFRYCVAGSPSFGSGHTEKSFCIP